MSGLPNFSKYTLMNASVKCDFASLKYEQLLTEKYFIETCFSKNYESYTAKQKLKDLWMQITFAKCK
jgi:hypothetical protein